MVKQHSHIDWSSPYYKPRIASSSRNPLNKRKLSFTFFSLPHSLSFLIHHLPNPLPFSFSNSNPCFPFFIFSLPIFWEWWVFATAVPTPPTSPPSSSPASSATSLRIILFPPSLFLQQQPLTSLQSRGLSLRIQPWRLELSSALLLLLLLIWQQPLFFTTKHLLPPPLSLLSILFSSLPLPLSSVPFLLLLCFFFC